MSDLSATDIALLAGAVVAVLAGFFAGITQVITAVRSTTKSTAAAVQQAVAETAVDIKQQAVATTNELHERLDSQDSALTEITSLTNGAASEQRSRIERLEALVREMVQAKADREVAAEHAKTKEP